MGALRRSFGHHRGSSACASSHRAGGAKAEGGDALKAEKGEEAERGPEEEEEEEALLPCEHCDSTAPPLMLDVAPPSCFDCGQPQLLCFKQRIPSIGPSGNAAAWGQQVGGVRVGAAVDAREVAVDYPPSFPLIDAQRSRRRSNNDNGSLEYDSSSEPLHAAAAALPLACPTSAAVVVGVKRKRPCSHSHGSVMAVMAMCQGCHGDRRMRLRLGRSQCLGAQCGCVCVS